MNNKTIKGKLMELKLIMDEDCLHAEQKISEMEPIINKLLADLDEGILNYRRGKFKRELNAIKKLCRAIKEIDER